MNLNKLTKKELIFLIQEKQEISFKCEAIKELKSLFDKKSFDKDTEGFAVLGLNAKNEILGKKMLFIGSVSKSAVYPATIFRYLLKLRGGCCKFIIAHNHPTGNVSPSKKDIELTDKLAEVGQVLDLELLDHFILGDIKSFSFAGEGLL